MDIENNKVARKNFCNKSQSLNSLQVAEVIVLLDVILNISKMISSKIRRKVIIITDDRMVFKDINEKQEKSR